MHGLQDDVLRDREALTQIAAKDAAALLEVWQRHRGILYRLCLRWSNGRVADAQDALGSVLIKTWEQLPVQAARVTNLRGWLSRLTRNVCIDLHRERERRGRLAPPAPEGTGAAEPPCGHLSPEGALLERERHFWVRRAVGDLPPTLRHPVLLRFFGDLSHSEIADRLQLNPQSVRKRIQYARTILERRLLFLREAARGRASRGRRRRGR